MAIGTRIGDQGPVSTATGAGFQVARNTENSGFLPYKVDDTLKFISNFTMSAGDMGLVTLSGSATALTGTLPVAAACPGAMFSVKNLNAVLGHQLTSSQDASGYPITDGYTKGSKLSMSPTGSVVMFCDGTNFMIIGGTSGSFAAGAAGSWYTISR
jgi:hypothetical protein